MPSMSRTKRLEYLELMLSLGSKIRERDAMESTKHPICSLCRDHHLLRIEYKKGGEYFGKVVKCSCDGAATDKRTFPTIEKILDKADIVICKRCRKLYYAQSDLEIYTLISNYLNKMDVVCGECKKVAGVEFNRQMDEMFDEYMKLKAEIEADETNMGKNAGSDQTMAEEPIKKPAASGKFLDMLKVLGGIGKRGTDGGF